MSENVKTTVTRVFKDGKLLSKDERDQEVTHEAVVFPEGVAVTRVSIGLDLPLILYPYGGNAKPTVHVSVPTVTEEEQISEAIKYAYAKCEQFLDEQVKQYTAWLDSKKIDWKKVEQGVK